MKTNSSFAKVLFLLIIIVVAASAYFYFHNKTTNKNSITGEWKFTKANAYVDFNSDSSFVIRYPNGSVFNKGAYVIDLSSSPGAIDIMGEMNKPFELYAIKSKAKGIIRFLNKDVLEIGFLGQGEERAESFEKVSYLIQMQRVNSK